MLEGSEIDEPMTLTQVVTRFTLRDMMERGESDEELDQVQLMTLHASKRAGVPVCLSGGMEEDCCRIRAVSMKIMLMKNGDWPMVVTRAQKELTFTLCKKSVVSMASLSPGAEPFSA